MSSEAIHSLKEACRPVWNLVAIRSLLGWDQQVMMPARGAGPRAQQLATLEHVHHEMLTAPRFADALYAAEEWLKGGTRDDLDRRFVRATRRAYDLAIKVPSKLVEERARATALAYEAWAQARQNNDFHFFLPHLREVFRLTREVAEHRGFQGHLYDAMLDEYEPGMTTNQVQALFSGLLPSLVKLVQQISEAPPLPRKILQQSFPLDGQHEFSRYLLQQIGFEFQAGRLDQSAHPFCSASSSRDVRLTDRLDPELVTMSMFGSLHEGGHGLYEQGSPPEWDGTPLAGGCSLGIHESQSRLWENMVGRSLPFWQAHFGKLQSVFPRQLSGYHVEDWVRAINYVEPSFIRVEADEVTYTLHVVIRFELEKAMLDGSLDPADLPGAWNEKMASYLGITPPNDSLGCLQDIHWSDGLIGYFPTYSLGNLVAAQLWRKVNEEVPGLQEQIAGGSCARLLEWLRDRVHRFGSSYTADEVIDEACGGVLDYQPFLDYLWEKFGKLYQLKL